MFSAEPECIQPLNLLRIYQWYLSISLKIIGKLYVVLVNFSRKHILYYFSLLNIIIFLYLLLFLSYCIMDTRLWSKLRNKLSSQLDIFFAAFESSGIYFLTIPVEVINP